MSTKSIKVLAATVMLTCGFGVGTGWLATADAQVFPVKSAPTKSDPAAEVKRLQAELDKARQTVQEADELAQISLQIRKSPADRDEPYTAKTNKWEYDFVKVSDMDQTQFVQFLTDRENRGWEYNGMTTLKAGGQFNIWIFRRPARAKSSTSNLPTTGRYLSALAANKLEDAKDIEAELKRLQDKLAALKKPGRTLFSKESLPLEPSEFVRLLTKMAEKKFKPGTFTIGVTADGIAVEGDAQVRDWVVGIVNKLAEK